MSEGIPSSIEESKSIDTPLAAQIRSFEVEHQPNNLEDEELRTDYAWLVSQWLATKSHGVFNNDKNELTPAADIYGSIKWIEAPEDNLAAWTTSMDSIWVNLAAPEFNKNQGEQNTLLKNLRNTLSHEGVHFMNVMREVSDRLPLFTEVDPSLTGETNAHLQGFQLNLYDENGVVRGERLRQFNEALTEIISIHNQTESGLAPSLPAYPDYDGNHPRADAIIKDVDAVLKLARIEVDDVAALSAYSDLEGLAQKFANQTSLQFESDDEKSKYGLQLIDAIERGDRQAIGEYIMLLA